jgi:hypothetical protein
MTETFFSCFLYVQYNHFQKFYGPYMKYEIKKVCSNSKVVFIGKLFFVLVRHIDQFCKAEKTVANWKVGKQPEKIINVINIPKVCILKFTY